ncbi:MAG: alkylation response protein AidB-like acyl-CoA dehydrogenase [Gammaproteobacteria bacterium]|jgi:alkylation response protein AidB-like acyl-CoA dehydrogenase
MDFKYTEEQTQLADLISRFVSKGYDFDTRRENIATKGGFDPGVWTQLAEMGVFAMTIPEEYDGLGGNSVDTLVIMQELGKGMLTEPYLATVVLGAGLIAAAGSIEQKAAILPGVAAGETKLAFAHSEAKARYNLSYVEATAAALGEGYVLNGQKVVVLGAEQADKIIVSARTSGNVGDKEGISLFVVDAAAEGLAVQGYVNYDGQPAAEVTLTNVAINEVDMLGTEGHAYAAIEAITEVAIAAVCAEAVGIMDTLVNLTTEYLGTRKQFNMPLGGFQALQHRLADMAMHREQGRSMALLATDAIVSAAPAQRAKIIAAAKSRVGEAATYVGQQAVQLHGGIGVTDELNVSHYFKRLTLINTAFGDSGHHLGVFSDLMVSEIQSAA